MFRTIFSKVIPKTFQEGSNLLCRVLGSLMRFCNPALLARYQQVRKQLFSLHMKLINKYRVSQEKGDQHLQQCLLYCTVKYRIFFLIHLKIEIHIYVRAEYRTISEGTFLRMGHMLSEQVRQSLIYEYIKVSNMTIENVMNCENVNIK